MASAFISLSSCTRRFGIEARVCSTLYFAWLTASSSPMPESRRLLRMSYVSLWSFRFARATRKRSCTVRREMYWLPISDVSDTHASASDQLADSIEASALSNARRVPPKMSISHDASKPLFQWSPCEFLPLPHRWEVNLCAALRV